MAIITVAAHAAPEERVTLESLTCRAFAAEVAAFDAAHPGAPRTGLASYRAVIAAAQARTRTSGNEREVAAAIDDTLIDCATHPDALLLDLLARHRIIADRWRD